MTNNQHGQVPEALIDLIDAYAETRHRCGGIYNARTEAARNAVIEALSGVQALSAAPMVTSEQRRLIGVIAEKIEDGTLFQSGIYQKKDLARFVRNMLDTTPTAPADSDLITIRKPTTQAEVVWLAKLAHLLVSDVNYTLGAMLEPKADSVQEDAARWHWLAEYLVGTRTDLDDEIVASKTVNDLRKLVEAAIKQGGKA